MRVTAVVVLVTSLVLASGSLLAAPMPAEGSSGSFMPVADGTTVDSNKDGTVDLVVPGVVAVGFDHLYWPGELRGVYEFDLRGRRGQAKVNSAKLMIPVNGTWGWASPNPNVTLYTGLGDGVVDLADYALDTGGRGINVYTYGSAIYLDVTTDVQNLLHIGAEFMTVVIRPNPASAGTAAAFYLASTSNARYGFQEALLSVLTGHVGSLDRPKGSNLVVENVRFTHPSFCSVVYADITNYGDAVEPAGWSITFAVPELGISSTFSGQQALVPSQRRTFFHNAQITAEGTFKAIVSAEDATGRTEAGKATFSIPCGTGG